MRIDIWTIFACTAVLIVFLLGFYLGSMSSNDHMTVNQSCVRSENGGAWWCLIKDDKLKGNK